MILKHTSIANLNIDSSLVDIGALGVKINLQRTNLAPPLNQSFDVFAQANS